MARLGWAMASGLMRRCGSDKVQGGVVVVQAAMMASRAAAECKEYG